MTDAASDPSGRQSSARLCGTALIVAAFVCNELLLLALLPPGTPIAGHGRVVLYAFQLAAFVLGLALVRVGGGPTVGAWIRTHRKLAATLLGLTVAGFALVVAELVAGRLLSSSSDDPNVLSGTYRQGFFVAQPLLGYGPRPGVRATSTLTRSDTTLYDVAYSIDDRGRRITPAASAPSRQSILFFGGSYTFGEGLEDDETLPAQVAHRAPEYAPLNYGFCGYGPQQMLVTLERDDLESELSAPATVAVYTFMDGHIERAIGAMRVFATWAASFPYYDLGADGSLQHRGNFLTGRPWTARLYYLVAGSDLATMMNVQLPPRIGERHRALTAAIVIESARRFHERFASERFYMLIYPGAKEADRVRELVEAAGVRTLDYSKLFDPSEPGMSIPVDGHPSAAANARVAEALVRDVALIE